MKKLIPIAVIAIVLIAVFAVAQQTAIKVDWRKIGNVVMPGWSGFGEDTVYVPAFKANTMTGLGAYKAAGSATFGATSTVDTVEIVGVNSTSIVLVCFKDATLSISVVPGNPGNDSILVTGETGSAGKTYFWLWVQ